MTEIINQPEDYNSFINDPAFIERTLRDQNRRYKLANWLKEKINSLLSENLFRKTDSIADVLDILEDEPNFRQIKIQIEHFLNLLEDENKLDDKELNDEDYKNSIFANKSVREFLNLLERIINESRQILKSYGKLENEQSN